ncbi:MAG TPA: hypothetical protein PLN06_03460 [Bacteroidales bacterium]|nr:hypothetical protein [Bacteroidales bacterium]HCI55413.1 hypothetical protein [Bacteroidales bacterium]HOU95664.1 hypothetical protein [Bacteroidales bacterium]HQG36011.1 hypothetical protein [Bacteroidales bacterium]HQG53183.1 hypothetical protein [Bacteroidales bacterium]
MGYQEFDRRKLVIKKLSERKNKLSIEKCHIEPSCKPTGLNKETKELIYQTACKIKESRDKGKPVIIAFGAHLIKNGLAPVMIELMKNNWVTHLAGNGAVSIHDWEFAYLGETSEDVRENVGKGQFGIWDETGKYINLALITGAFPGLGYGEAVGRMILNDGLEIPEPDRLEDEARKLIASDCNKAAAAIDLLGVIRRENLKPGFIKIPHRWKKYSVQYAAYELNIPFTIHPMIGHDIIYTHPFNHGSALGRTALTDFLRYVHSISNINEGVYLSIGSAIMSPMIFEKALSMAQNIAIQQNNHIDNHFIVVVDLAESNWNWKENGEPPVSDPAYYMRYNKTFSRMGGEMCYITADNRDFLLELFHNLER